MRRSILSLSAAAAVCLVLAACGAATATTPSLSPSPSPSPAAAIEPSPTASAAPMASAEPNVGVPGDSVPIPPDTYARVVTDDLRVRSNPGVTDDSTTLEPLLRDGVRVVVLDGPVQASGYDWYLVQPTITSDTADPYPFGWVAAAGPGWRAVDRAGDRRVPAATNDCRGTGRDEPGGCAVLRDHLLRREGHHVRGASSRNG